MIKLTLWFFRKFPFLPCFYITFIFLFSQQNIYRSRSKWCILLARQIIAGVLQGSKLRSWTYKIYIPCLKTCLLSMYADNTAGIFCGKSSNCMQSHEPKFIYSHISLVLCQKWRIKGNPKKSHVPFLLTEVFTPLHLSGLQVEYQGVTLDITLT